MLFQQGAFVYQISEIPPETKQIITFFTVQDLKITSLSNVVSELSNVAGEYNQTSPCNLRVQAIDQPPVVSMRNNQTWIDIKAGVDLLCRRNQVKGNNTVVPMTRVVTLIAKYSIEGVELTRDFIIRLKTDKIDISIQGFMREPSPLG